MRLEVREGVSQTLKSGFALPMLEWVNIPGGNIILSNSYGVVKVDQFAIAKYPTTNAQFQIFIQDIDGYKNDKWWSFSLEGQEWHRTNSTPQTSVFEGDKLPRESVNWYESMAYCAWLSDKIGLPVTLPTEMQWQRAAQGGDGRRYPFGKRYDTKKFNTSLSEIGRTTSVDLYPDGRSPFGVFDMSGNIWEWCLNKYHSPKDNNLAGEDIRVVRGGSWDDSTEAALVAFRTWSKPVYRLSSIGFRVALTIPFE
jgi:formylglycine-generating enzyme required for sulfatase activity